ncbi:hypothetical protein HMPREF1624_00648 [Sporothrix schenckii ATCC 58251]|uniref:Uncharacterized protein n=2 Tax=Sporothrix schenckii TaxID=29908 RepID=U7Q5P6_SPOS1|nr:hypothetical protein HMPREF1624_00648 [Sporothrix schenckii ATCC 58251]
MPSGSRVMSSSSGAAGYSGYYQEAPESAYAAGHGAMAYSEQSTDYAQDARQAHGFANTYNPSGPQLLYGVQPAAGQGAVFDTTQAYSSRQHGGGMQIITPDVTTPAYYTSDSATSGAVSLHTQAAHGGSAAAVYQHQGAADSRGHVAAAYGAGMVPLPSTTSSQPTSSTDPGASSGSAVAAPSSQDYAETNESYTAYQRTLKDVFKNTKSGALAPASESLLSISDWLLSRVEALGLASDDEDLYEGRVKLWKNFNNAWLGLLEKQKEMMWYGKKLHRSQSLVSFEDLQKMARELVRLCDGIERFGLVDYDYGVWEERIMAILTECVELYRMAEEDATGATSGPSSQQG